MKIAIFLILTASPAFSAPAPPPFPWSLKATQIFLRATKERDVNAYSGLLTENFVGDDAGQPKIEGRADWLGRVAKEFSDPRFHITPKNVFYESHDVHGEYVQQIMIIEGVDNFSFGQPAAQDCCAWYRTETLTLENDKIRKIDRSGLFDWELSSSGMRTDIPSELQGKN